MARSPSRVSGLRCHHMHPSSVVPPLDYDGRLPPGLPASALTLKDALHTQPDGTCNKPVRHVLPCSEPSRDAHLTGVRAKVLLTCS